MADDDIPALRARITEHQDYHRAFEPTWPAGADIAAAYLAYLQAECAAHAGRIFVAVDDRRTRRLCLHCDRQARRTGRPGAARLRARSVSRARVAAAQDRDQIDGDRPGLRNRRVTEVRLTVLEGNDEARAFYDVIGFKTCARILKRDPAAGS